MNQPENNEPTTPAAPEAPAPSPDPEPKAEAANPTSSATESSTDASHDDGDDASADEGDAAEGGEAKAEGEAGPAKKKRRRRRKKKPGAGVTAEGQPAEGGEAKAEGGEGAPAEGGRREKRERRDRPKGDRVERERPAFNVGDVVFGKVLEVTEDALFVDLAGKAKAIFDLRELLITDEDVEEYERAAKKEADEIAAARAASAAAFAAKSAAAAAAATGADGTPVSLSNEPVPPTEVSPGAKDLPEASEPAVAAPSGQPEASTAPAEASDAAPEAAPIEAEAHEAEAHEGEAHEGDGEGAAAQDGDKAPQQLPRVILEPGAPFVGLVHNDGGRGGLVVLTHHPKRLQKVKSIVADASKSGAMVFGLVTGTIKGGVEVDVDGLRAFAPASHVELRPGADLSHLVGKRLPFAVTQYAKRGRDVVLSRRAVLETEAKEKRESALKNLQIGGVVEGIVRTVVPFGAFVDIGGVEGLVPLSEMSHNRADQPKDVFKVNEPCKVKVLRVDEKGKLWLSRKAAIDDPWMKVAEKYSPGSKHTGKVARLQPFGAFIELEPGIDGLIHTADLSVKRIEHPEEVVKVGQDLEVVVAHVDPRAHRVALHPAPTGEAANEAPQRIQIHKTVKVVVVNVENGGLTVRVLGATGRNARGFVSAAATGTPRGTELRKLFPVGKELEAKIIEMDPRRGELKLSIKALNEETERNAYQQYRAQVKREAKFGTFADLLAKRNVTPSDK